MDHPSRMISLWSRLTDKAVSENAKDTLCRNVLIYGHCRYEDQGCAFNHDPNKGFGGIPEQWVLFYSFHYWQTCDLLVPRQNQSTGPDNSQSLYHDTRGFQDWTWDLDRARILLFCRLGITWDFTMEDTGSIGGGIRLDSEHLFYWTGRVVEVLLWLFSTADLSFLHACQVVGREGKSPITPSNILSVLYVLLALFKSCTTVCQPTLSVHSVDSVPPRHGLVPLIGLGSELLLHGLRRHHPCWWTTSDHSENGLIHGLNWTVRIQLNLTHVNVIRGCQKCNPLCCRRVSN